MPSATTTTETDPTAGTAGAPQAVTAAGKPAEHEWVGAATVEMTLAQAKRADLRGSFRVPEQTRIDVLEIYCRNCRRPYEEVAELDCQAAKGKDHLIGGPTGHRAKRTGHTAPGHDCVDLGCNTGIALAARVNGKAPDTRQARAAVA